MLPTNTADGSSAPSPASSRAVVTGQSGHHTAIILGGRSGTLPGSNARSVKSIRAAASTEGDRFAPDRPGAAARRAMVLPVQIGVVDDLVRGRCAPGAEVLSGVGIADERRVVPAHDRAVQRRSDAFVGLGADDDEVADAA